LKPKRQSRPLTYVNSYSETFSAGCTSVKGKIWVIYRKFSDKLSVICGNSNISNLTGNFRTLMCVLCVRSVVTRRCTALRGTASVVQSMSSCATRLTSTLLTRS